MSKKTSKEENETIATFVRTEDSNSVLSLDNREYVFPNKMMPKGIGEGEKLVLSVMLYSRYQEMKEKTAKDLLNEILKNGN